MITYPLYCHPYKLGTMKYPKRLGLIKIYVASHSKAFNGDIPIICKELTKTTIEELVHLYARTSENHNYESTLNKIVE